METVTVKDRRTLTAGTKKVGFRAKTIDEVVRAGLCSGCGICAYLQPGEIEIIDVEDRGRRPRAKLGRVISNGEAILACPGVGLGHSFQSADNSLNSELQSAWGPIRKLWEGFSNDPGIRYAGSSGGAASALALFALEKLDFSGVIHTAQDESDAVLNQTVISKTRREVLERTGSRYAPASPCEGLSHVDQNEGKFVFIGKPCDVAAVSMAKKLRPTIQDRLQLTIAFFCAGVPSTAGTLEMLMKMGVKSRSEVRQLRYRGNGWPGRATVVGDAKSYQSLSYEEAWGLVLTKHVQWRCRLCADHTGEFADVAVGDPWYRDIHPDEPGSSLIIARTKKGQELIEEAIRLGYLEAKVVSGDLLEKSQPNLLRARGQVWGRSVALSMIGVPAPVYRYMPTFRFWLSELTFREKVQSFFGTIRRCMRNGFHRWRTASS